MRFPPFSFRNTRPVKPTGATERPWASEGPDSRLVPRAARTLSIGLTSKERPAHAIVRPVAAKADIFRTGRTNGSNDETRAPPPPRGVGRDRGHGQSIGDRAPAWSGQVVDQPSRR